MADGPQFSWSGISKPFWLPKLFVFGLVLMAKNKQSARKRAPRNGRPARRAFGDGSAPLHPTTMAAGVMQIASTVGRPFQVVRTSAFTDIAKAAVDQGYVFNFTLNLLSTSDFNVLFDQYRVCWLELTFQWTNVVRWLSHLPSSSLRIGMAALPLPLLPMLFVSMPT